MSDLQRLGAGTNGAGGQSANKLVQVEPARIVALYDSAQQALAEATTLLDVMSVRNVSEMLKAQARLIKDPEAQARAFELRMRAERKLGEFLLEAKERGELSRGGRPGKDSVLGKAALADAGISHNLSSQAQKLAGFAAQQFDRVLAEGTAKIRSGRAVVINPVRDLKAADKQLRRQIREAQLAARQRALPQDKYGVILADPEWPDETWSEKGKDRSAANHYPLSTIEVIATRPVADIAADDAVLGLWIPMRHLAAGSHVPVMRGWGFEPKAIIIWDKVQPGTGYWVRNRVEALVIGVRGSVPAPAPGTQWEDLIVSPKDPVHSRKPDFVHEWFERFFPSLSKIELNARRARAGWKAWGLEAPEEGDGTEGPDGAGGEAVRQDEPADPAGGANHGAPGRSPLTDDSLAADPEGHPGALALDASGDGDQPLGGGEGRGQALLPEATPEPAAIVPTKGAGGELGAATSGPEPALLTSEEQNAIIRDGYSRTPPASIAELMAATGLKRSAVKMRVKRLGLSDPENQREAARALMRGINARRGGDSDRAGA